MSVFDEIRKEYETQGLEREDLAADPFAQFGRWFQEAVERVPGAWLEPNAMTLSTAAPCQSATSPSAEENSVLVTSRTVLLKAYDETGMVFFTNYQSEKGQQLAANPQAALLFHWPYLGRQIRINGTVEKTSRQISEDYFHQRPRGAQLGAAASQQSETIESRQTLDQRQHTLDETYEGQPVPLPDNWGGYRLCPHRFEFWQGRLDRMHDRFRYDRVQDTSGSEPSWQIARLQP